MKYLIAALGFLAVQTRLTYGGIAYLFRCKKPA